MGSGRRRPEGGGHVGAWAAGRLADGGRVVVTAARTAEVAAGPDSLRAADDAQRAHLGAGRTLLRFPYLGEYSPDELRRALADLVGHVAAGRLRVITRDRYRLTDAAAAHDAMAARRTVGKVVLTP